VFSGDWLRKIHGLRDFVEQVIVATGLWVPLITLFMVRGLLSRKTSVHECNRAAHLARGGRPERLAKALRLQLCGGEDGAVRARRSAMN